MEIFSIIIILIIFIVFSFVKHIRIRKEHPPGPLGFPYLGLIPFRIIQLLFSKYLPKTSNVKHFKEMKRKYGDIWSMEVGKQRIITLSSLDLMTEAFIDNGKMFSGRPLHAAYQIVSANHGILFIDGELWKGNRQLAIKAMRDLGMGKRDLENHICNEDDELINHLSSKSLSSIETSTSFVKAVSNVISRLVFNERNEYNDPKFEKYVQNLKHLAHSNATDNTLSLFPHFFQRKFVRKLVPHVDKFLTCSKETIDFIKEKCKLRIDKMNNEKNLESNCVFDYFWKFRFQNDKNLTDEWKFLDIYHSMCDLFDAGTDTTNNMLAFCCLLLGRYKIVQKDLKDEIRKLTDDHTNITMEMRKNCPKLLSFVDEVQRYCYLVPKVHHRVLEPCLFRGYKIIPNDIIFGDLFTISRDSKLFKNPELFDAYRFMDETKLKYIPNKSLIPFGIGKRACLGESIATMELFIFLSKIIHKFDIDLPFETNKNLEKIIEGHCGILHSPLDHEIIISY